MSNRIMTMSEKGIKQRWAIAVEMKLTLYRVIWIINLRIDEKQHAEGVGKRVGSHD